MVLCAALSLLFLAIHSTVAQSFTDFPPCAQRCITLSIRASGCDFANRSCVCRNSVYLNTVEQCELDTCDAASLEVAPRLARQYCNSTGIDLTNVHTTNPEDIISANSTIPQCGQECQTQAFAETGCTSNDFRCICTNQAFIDSVDRCENVNCTSAEHDTLVSYGAQLCSFIPDAKFAQSNATDRGLGKSNLTLTSIFDEPLCAQGVAVQALLDSGCKPSDFSCICRSPNFVNGTFGQAQAQECDVFDSQVLLVQFAQACANVGVPFFPSNGTFPNGTDTTPTTSALLNNPTPPFEMLNGTTTTTSAPTVGPTAPYAFWNSTTSARSSGPTASHKSPKKSKTTSARSSGPTAPKTSTKKSKTTSARSSGPTAPHTSPKKSKTTSARSSGPAAPYKPPKGSKTTFALSSGSSAPYKLPNETKTTKLTSHISKSKTTSLYSQKTATSSATSTSINYGYGNGYTNSYYRIKRRSQDRGNK